MKTDMPKPHRFTYPFCYTPHPLATAAADEVKRAVSANAEWLAEAERGKMFGVLVVETNEGLGFLAAYSGLFCGRNDWSFFVPPVYDLLHPDGHFKQKEDEITAINHRITRLENEPQRLRLIETIAERKRNAEAEEEAFRERMYRAKEERDRRRSAGDGDTDAMIRESQFLKAELRRLKKRNADSIREAEEELSALNRIIDALKTQRREMSEALQGWLFSQFSMLNARGERHDLCSIFADTAGRIPPSGAGECCTPKLLQYAYLHGMNPVCMAEFWWGASPKSEIRHHWHYYPSCRGKCLPILTHMLQGLNVDPNPLDDTSTNLQDNTDEGFSDAPGGLKIIYEDGDIIVADKPSGMLSVPGKGSRPSVYSVLREMYAADKELMMVHRLDMDTSGLLVVARNKAAHKHLQAQFLARTVKKRYSAIVECNPRQTDSSTPLPTGQSHGIIRLPMRPDPLDRPRQVIDHDHGKPAVTEWRVEKVLQSRILLSLTPHTGRTHQLRLHCAHADGLAMPILGDRLYGHSADRLYLHADRLEIKHPATGRLLTFDSGAKWDL